jgi:hypothetical protein
VAGKGIFWKKKKRKRRRHSFENFKGKVCLAGGPFNIIGDDRKYNKHMTVFNYSLIIIFFIAHDFQILSRIISGLHLPTHVITSNDESCCHQSL